ncbi:lipid-binding SYLF domain-containing protein [Tamlana agarivorans]|uniref:Lipid-binding SYLF domain-containing protein n=1 Tax=Pseudotamlana agarivorans TaxID=481183 RepID=A0ACC5UBY2_9FLAO|nr:lipid-binding SYLF domain-containing protein [Tamlana agarivorans]MBU2951846.1 lipid-binding SYLF domain-containing protein [Tamlana agarivorans]
MKSLKNLFVLLAVCCLSFNSHAQSKKDKKIINEADEAVKTLLAINPGIRHYFDKSAGCVVFPNVGKGGFIVGGASGNGVLYQYGEKKGMASLKELNVGLQAGGQALIEVIFFERKSDVEKFKEGHFEFDAGVSAVALQESKSLDLKYKDGVAVFTHAKGGLMAEASVGGQKFHYKPFH